MSVPSGSGNTLFLIVLIESFIHSLVCSRGRARSSPSPNAYCTQPLVHSITCINAVASRTSSSLHAPQIFPILIVLLINLHKKRVCGPPSISSLVILERSSSFYSQKDPTYYHHRSRCFWMTWFGFVHDSIDVTNVRPHQSKGTSCNERKHTP